MLLQCRTHCHFNVKTILYIENLRICISYLCYCKMLYSCVHKWIFNTVLDCTFVQYCRSTKTSFTLFASLSSANTRYKTVCYWIYICIFFLTVVSRINVLSVVNINNVERKHTIISWSYILKIIFWSLWKCI